MDTVNWDAAKFAVDAVQFVFTLAIAIWVGLRTGQDKNRAAIEEMDQRQDDLEKRIITAEEHLKHAPTHEDIAKVREEISGMQSALNTNTQMVQRIHDYLLNKD